MAGFARRRPALLSGSRGSCWRGVDWLRSRLEASPAGNRAWARSGRRGAETPVPGGHGGPGWRAGSPSRDSLPPLPLARPGEEGSLAGRVGQWFWASQPRGEDLPTWSGRVGVVFATLVLARVGKSSLYAFVPVNPWRGKGVRICCTYCQGFPLFEPLR